MCVFAIVISFYFLTTSLLYAGNLDNPNPPSQTMVTIDDVYNKISSGTPAVNHAIPTPSMQTLQEIYDILPGGGLTTAFETDVSSGKTFIKRVNGAMTFSTGTFISNTTNYYLPDTGQLTSYTTTYGEDNDYQPVNSQPSYTDNADGTITDNRTGLMWVKDGVSAGCNNGAVLSWEQALTFCENLNYAGYTDWRLPNAKELVSIADYGRSGLAINTTYFPNTQSIFYWTSTTYFPDTTSAWLVDFYYGFLGFKGKAAIVYVRPVRGCP